MLFSAGTLVLSGLSPFGTGPAKALSKEAASRRPNHRGRAPRPAGLGDYPASLDLGIALLYAALAAQTPPHDGTVPGITQRFSRRASHQKAFRGAMRVWGLVLSGRS
ncbi:hypothetical protein [Streptomyces palmae]|uniref:Uncharacterized protein n=1 Tax=Streptomyces palmae TaxID=1701085 RepID=A0A4Z0HD01_9ACTN|nr:hypothetical protein [Streptomyces palmae]TGB09171.1 hypothetical protein E4099_14125 [Streptomyces palmae]